MYISWPAQPSPGHSNDLLPPPSSGVSLPGPTGPSVSLWVAEFVWTGMWLLTHQQFLLLQINVTLGKVQTQITQIGLAW